MHALIIISGLTGAIFLVAGIILYKFPPKKINYLYGYRTLSSIKNQERWDFAQTYSAVEMMKIGIYLIALGLIGLIYNPGETAGFFLSIGAMLLLTIYLYIKVEQEIKKRFPE